MDEVNKNNFLVMLNLILSIFISTRMRQFNYKTINICALKISYLPCIT